jgi:hypothetical protein
VIRPLADAGARGYRLILPVIGALALTAGSRRPTLTVSMLRRAPTDQARIAIGAADIAQA